MEDTDGPYEFTNDHRSVLDFEKHWWKHQSNKAAQIQALLGLTTARYYHLLNAAIGRPDRRWGSMRSMDPIETLVAIEEIKQLVARRCRSLDEQNWESYAACHTPDVVSYAISSESGTEAPTRGIDAVLGFLREQLAGRTTVHHVHSPEIELTGADTATGTWAMEDQLWWERDGTAYWIHGFGHYRETYEKRDGQWLVASRRLDRTRVERGSGTP